MNVSMEEGGRRRMRGEWLDLKGTSEEREEEKKKEKREKREEKRVKETQPSSAPYVEQRRSNKHQLLSVGRQACLLVFICFFFFPSVFVSSVVVGWLVPEPSSVQSARCV